MTRWVVGVLALAVVTALLTVLGLDHLITQIGDR